ncbi:MAG: hypothetical protein ACHQ9S_17890 [Candidatus Binatia bacterium]
MDRRRKRSSLLSPRASGSAPRLRAVAVVVLSLAVASGIREPRVARAQASSDAFLYAGPDLIPENTWVKLSSPPTLKYLPHDWIYCDSMGELPNPIGRVRSGVAYGDGKLFYFGGLGGHPGNDVELYDIKANAWRQTYKPECIPACCCVPGCDGTNPCSAACNILEANATTALTPLGRPYVEHTYALAAYNPSRHKFAAALTSGMWDWDPLTNMWTQLTPTRPLSEGLESKHLTYDPDVGILYFATAPPDGPPAVYVYDYTTNVWMKLGNMPQEIFNVDGEGEFYTAYDTKHRVHLASHLGSRNTFWLFDAKTGVAPDAGTWTRVADVPAFVFGAASFDYDPSSDSFVVAQRGADGVMNLWSFRDGDGWSQLSPVGKKPAGEAAFSRDWGTLKYDPLTGRFYLVNVLQSVDNGTGGISPGDVETWTLRAPQRAGDPNCDGLASAADLPAFLLQGSGGTVGSCGAAGPSTTFPPDLDSLIRELFNPVASGLACADPTDARATFAIKSSGDDAYVSGSAHSYPLNASASLSVDSTKVQIESFRSGLDGTDFVVYNGLLRWDTSSLPDGATIKQAWLRFHVIAKGFADALQLTAGWYDWSNNGGAGPEDWTATPETSALAGINISDLTVGSGYWNVVPLSGFEQGVSTSGFSSLRLHISERPNDEAPTGQNYVIWSSFESGLPAELTVCYSNH